LERQKGLRGGETMRMAFERRWADWSMEEATGLRLMVRKMREVDELVFEGRD